jgi:hypothetical protein
MGKRNRYFSKRHKNDQQIYEEVLTIINRKWKSKRQGNSTSRLFGRVLAQKKKIKNVCKDVKKRNFVHSELDCKSVEHYIEHYVNSSKNKKTKLPNDSATPLLGIHPKELKSGPQRNNCIPMFIVVLFTIIKTWSHFSTMKFQALTIQPNHHPHSWFSKDMYLWLSRLTEKWTSKSIAWDSAPLEVSFPPVQLFQDEVLVFSCSF